jgi:ribosomal protein RSM22 (predicted rRNA methylase)
MQQAEQRLAYLAVRLPATFAACQSTLAELARRCPTLAPASLLELGAGPGTASWAALEAFPSLRSLTLLERDPALIALGRQLAAQAPQSLRQAEWQTAELTRADALPADGRDIVLESYLFNELGEAAALRLLARAWPLAQQALVLVEPGSRQGFAVLSACRRWLLEQGAHLAAPCPHAAECPAEAAGDWCHFAARLERSSLHRRLKGGALGFEDETFCYLIATRAPCPRAEARILRHPQLHGGHLQLTLCTAQGIETPVIGRSAKQAYRRARKSAWGDEWSTSAAETEE